MSEERAELVVNGTSYDVTESLSLHFSIEELAPSFDATYSERTEDNQDPVQIVEGDAIEITVDDEVVLTGYVDRVGEVDSGTSHDLTIRGRAKTSDLVDCSYESRDTQLNGKSIEQIGTLVCAPYGIAARLDPALSAHADFLTLRKPIARFTVAYGETPFEALTRAARLKGLLLTTNAVGDLLFTRPASVPSLSLLRRGLVDRWSYDGDAQGRYSDYYFTAQNPGTDTHSGKSSTHVKTSVKDSGVKRSRKLALLPEHHATTAELQQRAVWERNTRAAQSQRLGVNVQGWSGLGGLWQPNQLPRVINEVLGIDDNLLISAVDLTIDNNGGRMAALQLVGRGAYNVLEPPAIKRSKKGRGVL